MKGKVSLYILFLCIVSVKCFSQDSGLSLDTVIKRTMLAAETHNDRIECFSAEVYMRTYVETLKKNFLYKYTHHIPNFVLHDPHHNTALIETISDLQYDYPNNYVQDVRHVTGTITDKDDIEMIPFELLNINIYGETTNDESFFMPIRQKTSKYYRYSLARTFIEDEKTYFSIRYDPIYENSKLLKGVFIVEQETWRVIFFRGEGVDIFSDFSFEITMGDEDESRFLPIQFTIYETSSYLGNVLASRHLANIDYQKITLRSTIEPEHSLNLSDFYRVRLDSVPVHSDSVFWNHRRHIPLQATEKEVMTQHLQRQKEETKNKEEADTLNNPNFARQMQRVALNSKYKYRSTAIGYSGLFNPLLIGYSSYDGVTYRQKLSFDFDLKHSRTITIDAFAGYIFRHKELLTDLTTTWNYEPYKLGSATISIGNGIPTYSSLFVDQIQDSLDNQRIDFEDISVRYYKDYYLQLFNTYEVTNGLLVQLGINYHIRKSKDNLSKLRSASTDNEPIKDLFGTKKSFAPFARISWTPRQYYRYVGRQKIYERSPFPTFKLELSRSFQHILGSSTEFDRIEVDISQNIPFGLRHSLQYHVGAGTFINQQTEYFADFVYFSKSHFPDNWDDGLGGNFNLLSRNLYNASESYIQAHAMFETPFLILKNIPFISDFAENERIYLSYLHTPQIVSYTEFGYGIGNRFFNAGVFSSFHKTDFKEIGVRAAFKF